MDPLLDPLAVLQADNFDNLAYQASVAGESVSNVSAVPTLVSSSVSTFAGSDNFDPFKLSEGLPGTQTNLGRANLYFPGMEQQSLEQARKQAQAQAQTQAPVQSHFHEPDQKLSPLSSLSPTDSRRQLPNQLRLKRYACTFQGCDKVYNRPCLLNQHVRSHVDLRPFACEVEGCGKAFLRVSHLKAHMLSHSDQRPLQCGICGKGFNTNQHLRRHESTHVARVTCTEPGCNEAFKTRSQLRRHVTEAHTADKRFACNHCAKAFNSRAKLDVHELKNHSEIARYHCGRVGCGRQFQAFDQLQAHIRDDHSGDDMDPLAQFQPGPEDFYATPMSTLLPTAGTPAPQDLARVSPPASGSKLSMIDLVTGAGYDQSGRTIPCPADGCQYLFSRDYDLRRHIAAMHRPSPDGSAGDLSSGRLDYRTGPDANYQNTYQNTYQSNNQSNSQSNSQSDYQSDYQSDNQSGPKINYQTRPVQSTVVAPDSSFNPSAYGLGFDFDLENSPAQNPKDPNFGPEAGFNMAGVDELDRLIASNNMDLDWNHLSANPVEEPNFMGFITPPFMVYKAENS